MSDIEIKTECFPLVQDCSYKNNTETDEDDELINEDLEDELDGKGEILKEDDATDQGSQEDQEASPEKETQLDKNALSDVDVKVKGVPKQASTDKSVQDAEKPKKKTAA